MEIQRFVGRAAAAVAVSALMLLAGPTHSAMAAASSDGTSSVAVAKPGPGGVVITVVGVVTEGVENGCKILATGSGSGYLLLGGGADTPYGARVRVTGEVRPDIMTTCQQGTPLVVRSVTPV